ncbi:hypothetical protein HUT19_37595 [Streptomyces sp. NA02950]|uniref:phage/plasmid primase, P4 family n=1 Tax=Streptomyces sp. NA02950 TaxID=2742137 RepID=UPI00158FF23C|nr:phage/plasmid primase, P4 family [Streptomyces sp. NA02950]QKV96709.1 hypothetical protein HUT19_37595 [Streptomyces sp. NA02950]
MYKTPEAKPVFREVKTEGKGFFVQTYAGGTWKAGLPKKYADLLYRADALATATGTVYWVEGPKDAESLREAGYLATTTHGGVPNFKESSVAYFGPGITLVVVVPDEDEAGYKLLAKKIAALKKHNIPYEVRGVPEGKDATDALALGYNPEDWWQLTPEDIEERTANPYLHRLLRALTLYNDEPKDIKPGQPTPCPAHTDDNPSFSCDEGDDKAVKLYCFAGCGFDEVCKALDIPQKDVDRLLDRQKKAVLNSSRLPKTDSHTHNAAVAIERLAGQVVYVRDHKEYYAFVQREGWRRDRSIVRRIIQQMGEEQLKAGMALVSEEGATEKQKARGAQLIKSGYMCLSNPGQKNIMEVMSQSTEMVIIDRFSERFDTNPNILVCKNGVVELKETGHTFRTELRPDDWTTLSTGVDYIPAAFCADLDKVLTTFWPEDEVRDYLHRAMGYSLLGGNPERWFFVMMGVTTGGKTTLAEAVASALGDYADTYQQSLFHGNVSDKPRPDLLSLMPRRVISSSEAGEGWTLHGDRIKNLTGAEPLKMRDLFAGADDTIRREPMYTPWMSTNSAPKITGIDEATARRICAIPCDVSISKADEDPTIRTRLKTSETAKRGTLAWLVKGWDEYCAHKLTEQAESIQERTNKFLRDASGQGGFFESCILKGEADEFFTTNELWPAYQTWAHANDVRDGFKSQAECTRAIAAACGNQKPKGQRKRVNGVQQYVILGYRLITPGDNKESN